jgi:hypothetical protein
MCNARLLWPGSSRRRQGRAKAILNPGNYLSRSPENRPATARSRLQQDRRAASLSNPRVPPCWIRDSGRAVRARRRGAKRSFDVTQRTRITGVSWDGSAPYVVGEHLKTRPRDVLDRLAASKNLWERRIAPSLRTESAFTHRKQAPAGPLPGPLPPCYGSKYTNRRVLLQGVKR